MIGVAIMGCGIVGSGVAEMLTQNANQVRQAANEELKLKTILDIREIIPPKGVSLTHDFSSIESDAEIQIVVETIGGETAAYDLTKRALLSGRHVVTSNKALVVARGEELMRIAREKNVRYLFEASVGGGIPVIRPLGLCLSGNRVDRIDGIINGSTNYLLTRMDDIGMSFSAALSEAQRLGYVEGNPEADIEGWDAKRKIAILAHVGFGARLSDADLIPTEGISRITDRDLRCARALGGKAKLVASAKLEGDIWTGWVAPAFVPESHAFYSVGGVNNAIRAHGDFIGDVMFVGQGAGGRPTASAVLGDIIDIARQAGHAYISPPRDSAPQFVISGDEETALAFRLETEDMASAREDVLKAIPGAHIREVEDMLAVITPTARIESLRSGLDALKKKKHRSGAQLRVLE